MLHHLVLCFVTRKFPFIENGKPIYCILQYHGDFIARDKHGANKMRMVNVTLTSYIAHHRSPSVFVISL